MSKVKGIVLAGGSGTRLYPLTQVISKQLLPIYNKPMIYYPLSTLMLAGIDDVLIISTPQDQPLFQKLLGDGSNWGMSLRYAIQEKPEGLAQAFIIARDFIKNNPSCLILGDNIFYGQGLVEQLENGVNNDKGATVFGYWVNDPERYGVVEFDQQGKAIQLIEKPEKTSSNYAITGLYFYDQQVCDMANQLKKSARGELEITDINALYLAQGQLTVEKLGRGTAWLDTGTHESLKHAVDFIATIETRQGLMISCPEEIAYNNGWINVEQVQKIAQNLSKNSYGDYLLNMVKYQL